MPLTDNSPMPYGVFKGRPLIEISASYLIWLYENNKCSGELRAYIESNLSVLKNELKKEKIK